jgi:hypothetical protein
MPCPVLSAEELVRIGTIFDISCYCEHVKPLYRVGFIVTLISRTQKIQGLKIKILSFDIFEPIPI